MRKHKIGNITLTDTVDVTDPCYNKDVRYRINEIPVLSGNYTCYVWEELAGEYDGLPYYINGKIAIYKDSKIPKMREMQELGFIGVDSGMAGFFHDKPDYDADGWRDFCNAISYGKDCSAWINNDGFFANTGYGDGEYKVRVHRDWQYRIDAIEIICD